MALKLELLRPDDLLNLQIECHNLKLDTADAEKPVLVPIAAEKDCHLVFIFPSQTVEETAFFEVAPVPPPPGQKPPTHPDTVAEIPTVPVRARLGGESRLVFRIPADAETRIPYSLDGLLNWAEYEFRVSAIADVPENPASAQVASVGSITAPDALESAIEFPYRMILSPNHNIRWKHSFRAVTHESRTELWHTRLTSVAQDGAVTELSRTNTAPLRATWSPDYNSEKPPDMGGPDPDSLSLTAMSSYDRHSIVVLTSAFHGYVDDDNRTYRPLPIHAEQFMLSPLGGWLKSRGNWEPPYKWHSYFEKFAVTPWNEFFLTKNIRRLTAPESAQENVERESGRRSRAAAAESAELREEETSAENISLSPDIIARRDVSTFFIPSRFGVRDDNPLSVSEWVHIATLGRDHYVRIVYEGHLYPFGHRAALVKVTERQIRHMGGKPLAYQVQRMFIMVRQPLKDYSAVMSDPLVTGAIPKFAHYDRYMPLRSIRLTTLVTPDIDRPDTGKGWINGTEFSTWVMVNIGGTIEDFEFHGIAEDYHGRHAEFSAPLIFIPFTEAADKRETVHLAYATSGDRRACVTNDQKLTFAPPADDKSENTTFATRAVFFDTQTLDHFEKKYGGFLPIMLRSNVRVPAVEQLLGQQTITSIALTNDYQANGLVNPGGVFAWVVKEIPGNLSTKTLPQLAEDKLAVTFEAKKAGGIATPNLGVSCLSSTFGTLAGDIGQAAANNFNPAQFFPKGSAQLFGVLDLCDLILAVGTMDDNAPKMEITTQNGAAPKVITRLQWKPSVQNHTFGILDFIAKNGDTPSTLEIKADLERPINPGANNAGTSHFHGELKEFTLDFLKVIRLRFTAFTFDSVNGSKLDVDVKLDDKDPVRFQGDLEFVEKLRDLIPPGLLGNGPSLDINTQRVRAGFAIALPPAAVGVFALKGVSLAAALELPFSSGTPTFDFSFSERHHPFVLTIAFLGGGGFFHLQLDTNGIKQLEAALEFGAVAALDIGVASGSVHIMAGIYFAMERKDGVMMALLSGYFRAGGELSVLGLVSISVEFNLTFIYYSDPINKCKGRATLTVTIEIAFFSKSIELSVEKSFGKGSGDPTFAQLIETAAVWDEYASAFA